MVMLLHREYCLPVAYAGEYNLRLGITKELHPDMVATYQGVAGTTAFQSFHLLVGRHLQAASCAAYVTCSQQLRAA